MTAPDLPPADPVPAETTSTPPRAAHGTPRPVIRSAACLLGLCALVMALKYGATPWSEALRRIVNLEEAGRLMGARVSDLVFVPLAAVIVTFLRMTLGIRMLGPFRPILIAIGLRYGGIPTGIAVLVAVIALITMIRPRLRHAMPYTARLSALLAVVVLMEVVVVLVGYHTRHPALLRVAFFPIIVLCLAADGFARALVRKGRTVALSRVTATVVAAVAINLAAATPGLQGFLLRHPEMILAEIAAIALLATAPALRPAQVIRRRLRERRSAAPA